MEPQLNKVPRVSRRWGKNANDNARPENEGITGMEDDRKMMDLIKFSTSLSLVMRFQGLIMNAMTMVCLISRHQAHAITRLLYK